MRTFGTIAVFVALLLSTAAAAYLLSAPAYEGLQTSSDTEGYTSTVTTTAGLIETNGWYVLVPVLFPVAVCAAVLASCRTRWFRLARGAAALLLLAFTVITGFSIGLLYAPSALAMTVAAIIPGRN